MSKQRQKGTAFETLIINYLRKHGFPNISRSPLHGSKDRGDALNSGPFTFEMKNHQQLSLGSWVDEATVENQNAGRLFPVVIHKRKRSGRPEDQFVTMPLAVFCTLVPRIQ